MITSLHQFQDRVEQLLAFLDEADAINALASAKVIKNSKIGKQLGVLPYLTRLQSSKIDRKVQTYVTGIILLYGLFEQYIEEVLVAYLEELDSIVNNFDDMPKKIRENHTSFSAQLLMNKELDKYRERCNDADVVQRMKSCIDKTPFQLNTLAFIDHKSNFRIEPLNKFFEVAGIPGISALMKKTKAFKKYAAKKFPGQKIDGLPDAVVFEDLDDLAWRRNIVAHGWPDDTLSIDMMKERAEFIRLLGEAVYQVLKQSIFPYFAKHQCYALPKAIAVFNKSIVCFHLEEGFISIGAQIVVRSTKGDYLEGTIIKIEINHVDQTEVTAPPALDVACLVDLAVKKNYQYFLVNKRSDANVLTSEEISPDVL